MADARYEQNQNRQVIEVKCRKTHTEQPRSSRRENDTNGDRRERGETRDIGRMHLS